MQIQVHSHQLSDAGQELTTQVESVVEDVLSRFSGRIARVEVHLSDENSAKGGHVDKRCMMEARLEGRRTTAVTSVAPTVDQAVNSAIHKLRRTVGDMFETVDAYGGTRRR